MNERIKQYAMMKTGLTPEQHTKASKHAAFCKCETCGVFEVYLRIKKCIEEWEGHKSIIDCVQRRGT